MLKVVAFELVVPVVNSEVEADSELLNELLVLKVVAVELEASLVDSEVSVAEVGLLRVLGPV